MTGELEGQRIVVVKTYDEMAALMAANGLSPFLWYKISDRGDNGLVFRAASGNRLENDGLRYMLCPATYEKGQDAYENNWLGVWHGGLTPSADDLAIWGGLVWKNLTGMVGSSEDDFNLDETNWEVITKLSFTNHEYVELIIGVSFDFNNDWITKQWDNKGNIFTTNKEIVEDKYGEGINPAERIDFNQAGIKNNTCMFILNNTTQYDIKNNRCLGYILNNVVEQSISDNLSHGSIKNNNVIAGRLDNNFSLGDISQNTVPNGIYNNYVTEGIMENTNNGEISYNNCLIIGTNTNNGNITMNFNNGYIVLNSSGENSCNIQNNTNNGSISGVWDADVTDAVVDKEGAAE